MTSLERSLGFLSVTLATLATLTAPARAQLHARDSEGAGISAEERARIVFNQARALMLEERYAKACALFEQSLGIVEGIGTLYNLGDCYEKLGRTASAHEMFRRASAAAAAAGQDERAEAAFARRAALEARVPRILVQVAEGDAAESARLELALDGAPLRLDETVLVDPGMHLLTARAPGKRPWQTRLRVPDESFVISVTVPTLEPGADAVRAPEPVRPPALAPESAPLEAPGEKPKLAPRAPLAPSAPRGAAPRGSTPHDQARSNGTQRAALVVGSIGLVAAATGTVFAIRYKQSDAEARGICPSGLGCTQDEVSRHAKLVGDAKHARLGAYLGWGLGAVALGSATVLSLSSSKAPLEPRVGARATLAADGSWAASIDGSF